VQLPIEADAAHPMLDAIVLLRGLYRRHACLLPDGVNIRLSRAWREAIDSYDRLKAMVAFEWATLFALRVALRNGTIFIGHSFSFRSQTHMLIPTEEWHAKRNHLYGHVGLPQEPREFLGTPSRARNPPRSRGDRGTGCIFVAIRMRACKTWGGCGRGAR
jgi:hypothetical protein